jgi:hypothetical protein
MIIRYPIRPLPFPAKVLTEKVIAVTDPTIKASKLSITINGNEILYDEGGFEGPLDALSGIMSVTEDLVSLLNKALDENNSGYSELHLGLAIAILIEQASASSDMSSVKLASLVRQNIAHITDD